MFGNKTETARYKIVEQKFTKYSKPFYSIYDKLEELIREKLDAGKKTNQD